MNMWVLVLYTLIELFSIKLDMKDEDSCVAAAKELTRSTFPHAMCVSWEGEVLYFEYGRQVEKRG